MAIIDMNSTTPETFSLEGRGIVIIKNEADLRGGKTLDCTGFSPNYITTGHVVIIETSTGTYKPMPVNVGMTAYESLPAGHTYVGVVVNHEVPKTLPFVGVMVHGVINPLTAPYQFSTTIATAFKTAVPAILQIAD